MVIHRAYKLSPTAPPPDRRPLGRVLVTLDDMRVLMEMLLEQAAQDPDAPPFGSPVALVEYDEGVFTAAEDMRELSNANLRDLRVKCDETTVHLSPARAEAIGPAAVNDLIQNAWARSRQTRKRPKTERNWWSTGFSILAALFGLYAIASLFFPDAEIEAFYRATPLIYILAMISLVALFSLPVIATVFDREIFTTRPKNYAVIVAFTQDELRKQESGRSKWPVISATIGAVALMVSLTFNLINLMRH